MPTTAELVKKYIELRDTIDARTKAFEESLAPFKAGLVAIEGAVTQQMNELDTESVKTEFGTAYRSKIMQTRVADRELFMDFVFDGRLEGFLTSAVAKDAVKEYLDTHEGRLPPGVEVAYINKVNFRRAS